jgi:Reverse transcriptase (RNA-dependent DNA polymerase)
MFLGDQAGRDPQEIANLFVNFFQSGYVRDDATSTPLVTPSYAEHSQQKVSLTQFEETAAQEAILDLDVHKGPGPDGIPRMFSLEFGKSLSSSQFLRIAKSVISLATVEFPFFPQYQKCLKKWLTPIISAKISDRKHGYMKGRSTVTNLVEFPNFAFDEMENGRQVDCVYTDFSKAFDRVNHALLGFNLSKDLEGPMLGWSGSYLTGRTQRVKLSDYVSEPVYCYSGVPQGSYLGPLFFIDDVDEVFRIFEHFSALGYADDLKLFMAINNVEDCQRFQDDLD